MPRLCRSGRTSDRWEHPCQKLQIGRCRFHLGAETEIDDLVIADTYVDTAPNTQISTYSVLAVATLVANDTASVSYTNMNLMVF